MNENMIFTFLLICVSFNPIQDGPFRGCSRMGWGGVGGAKSSPLPKICHIYPTMMKLGAVIPYLMKIQKIYESRDTPLNSAEICDFHPKSANFATPRNTDIHCILIHDF